MIDLNEKYISFIKKTFDEHLTEYKLYLFGSRAKGNAKKYSDIDLAIDSKNFNSEIKSKLENFFSNSTIPYEIDIIDLNNINDQFKQLIKNDLIEI